MGNTLSLIFKAVFPCLAEEAQYLTGFKDNLETLKEAIANLEARSYEVLNQVKMQEMQGLPPLQEVQLWLSRVEAIGPQVCDLLDRSEVELQRFFMYGYCSNDFRLTYPYSKLVFKKMGKVELLLSTKPTDEMMARRGMPPDTEERPTQRTIGLEEMLEATWKRLVDDEVGILGLSGMGGVGKTTLLEQIKKKFLEKRNEYDFVIYVVVSQDLQIGSIQKGIGMRLGFYCKPWEQKPQNEKASDIKRVLTTKRFVILLDDIWRKVELKEIGIPLPSPGSRSKVVYTTRSRKVCGLMGPNDMEVKCLDPENAWKLFQQKVRPSALENDPEILKLARKVCGICKGLPLALNVIGETMACKTTVSEWQYAIGVLTSNVAKYPEVEDEILKILKFSYDVLEDKGIQKCFQYCALYPKDSVIDKDRLVEYWISEGLVNGGGKKEEAVNHGYAVIRILVDAGLLINLEDIESVKMHDVIRQMALWIASNYGEERDNFVVKIGAGLHQMPEVENWNAVRRMSLQNNRIQTISAIPECPNLTTLIFKKNKLVSISGECFMSMPKLVVLDLSYNKHLSKLPEEVSRLVSLRHLGLIGTRLEELPMGLSELIQLRYLDLDLTEELESMSVISSLLNLERLRVFRSTPLSLDSGVDRGYNVTKEFEILKRNYHRTFYFRMFFEYPEIG